LQSLCLFYNPPKCILLFLSHISSLLLLFFLSLLFYWEKFPFLIIALEGSVYVIYSFILVFFKVFCSLKHVVNYS
jgi:hypothetical protein